MLVPRVLEKVIPLIGIVAFLVACANDKAEQRDLIQKIDFATYQDYILSAKSDEEIRRIDSMVFQEVETYSIGRYIPSILAKDKNNQLVRIDSLINQPTMVVLYSPFCGWSSVNLAEDLPKALEGISNPPQVVCLFMEEENRTGIELPENFFRVQQEQLSFLYPNFYIIQPEEAQKLNMYALPSRYYFNGEGKLVKIEKGSVPVGRMKKEILTFLGE